MHICANFDVWYHLWTHKLLFLSRYEFLWRITEVSYLLCASENLCIMNSEHIMDRWAGRNAVWQRWWNCVKCEIYTWIKFLDVNDNELGHYKIRQGYMLYYIFIKPFGTISYYCLVEIRINMPCPNLIFLYYLCNKFY